jgi:hypothetical protein
MCGEVVSTVTVGNDGKRQMGHVIRCERHVTNPVGRSAVGGTGGHADALNVNAQLTSSVRPETTSAPLRSENLISLRSQLMIIPSDFGTIREVVLSLNKRSTTRNLAKSRN